MDFMKVLDQTVREIKREVNLKVLKVPEIEQKVLDATSDEPWGPHGSALAEIARETKKITECQMIMNVLWTRLTDTGPNWRHVYKALSVIEYLVANGSDRAVDDIIEHAFQISSLSGFEYVEPNGKDMGINVRKKVETILGLLNDREKIKAVRDKAAATRDKYFGLSSSGVTYKSSAAAFGSSNFRQNDRFGGISSSREGESFKDSYKGRDQYGEETGTENAKSKNEVEHRGRVKDSFSSSNLKTSDKQGSTHSSKSTNAQMSNNEDDFDDFDPRGSSTSGSAAASSKQVDLFGGSLLIDLMDEPVSVPTETATSETAATAEVDLFADAAFVSAPPHAGATAGSRIQENMDLFANQPAAPTSFSSKVDLFEIPDPVSATVTEPPPPEPTNSSSFDPFAAVPLNNFDDSDFGTFTSHTGSTNLESSQGSPYDSFNNLNSTSTASKPPPKKGTFQVKSGIWADSLSRGLIDLNITAPSAAKKTSLADIGIVGGLGDATEDKGTHASVYMGRAMGLGTGLGRTGFSSSSEAAGKDDFFGAFK